MDTLSYKTVSPSAHEVEHEWVLIDATGLHLGRLCSQVAKILRGKNKPSYTPYTECGDNVIIINADKVVLTGKKMTDHIYLIVYHCFIRMAIQIIPKIDIVFPFCPIPFDCMDMMCARIFFKITHYK